MNMYDRKVYTVSKINIIHRKKLWRRSVLKLCSYSLLFILFLILKVCFILHYYCMLKLFFLFITEFFWLFRACLNTALLFLEYSFTKQNNVSNIFVTYKFYWYSILYFLCARNPLKRCCSHNLTPHFGEPQGKINIPSCKIITVL